MRGFLLGFIVALVCAIVPVPSFANSVSSNQAGAYSACQSEGQYQVVHGGWGAGATFSCEYQLLNPQPATAAQCPSLTDAGEYNLYLSNVNLQHSQQGTYVWCVPSSCVAGDTPFGTDNYRVAYAMATGEHGIGGCCYTLDLVQAGMLIGGGPDDGFAEGHWVGTGARCVDAYGAPGEAPSMTPPGDNPEPDVPPDNPCGVGKKSCITPKGACAQSESGEWFCEPITPDKPGGCISGATGSLCVGKDGNPAPSPPDPPIPKNTAPDTHDQYNVTDSGGNTTTITTNSYSGTSPGSGSNDSPSSGSSTSPGGTGSNSSGSGNSGAGGTGSDGKCADGSVPTASGCSGTYRDDGCDTPPACHGDAVMCGIAANTHKTACEVAAASGGSAGGPPSGMGDGTDNSGDPAGSSVSNSVDLGDGSNLDGGGFGFASTCPLTDGIHFDFLGKSISVDTSDMCTPLGFIYYIVLAFAYFAAAKIIAGVK